MRVSCHLVVNLFEVQNEKVRHMLDYKMPVIRLLRDVVLYQYKPSKRFDSSERQEIVQVQQAIVRKHQRMQVG